ncbi:MAG: methionine aminotransferase [Luteibaculum sp.]
MLASSVAVHSKLPHVGQTIFSKMSAMAQQFGAINLSQGFPDFPIDPALSFEVANYMATLHNQYAPSNGTEELRTSVSALIRDMYGQSYDPKTEILITAGATQAIQSTIQALVKEGDEVLLFTPAYDCYAPLVELSGATPVYCQLKFPDYSIDWNECKRLLNRRTKLIILNSPHNPSGRAIGAKDVDELIKITEGTDIIILSDEVYHNVVFDGRKNYSLSAVPKLAERSIIVGSLSKMLHVTGWKLGYCLAPKVLLTEISKIHQYTVFSVNTPMQLGVASYMEKNRAKILTAASLYQSKRDVFLNAIKGGKFKALPCHGSYFCLLDYSEVSDLEDVEFTEWLVENHGVSTIPLSVFYNKPEQNKVIRVCFAKGDDILLAAANKLNAL